MLGSVLEVLFPSRCLGCGARAAPFCGRCASRVAVLVPPGCARCGRPFEGCVPRCGDCPPGPIAWARSAFLYEGPVRSALMRLKFGGLRSFAEGMAGWMVGALDQAGAGDGMEITWVPLGRGRRRTRGFDQAEALALQVARLTGRPARPLLRRVAETPPQARRVGADRRTALRNAFQPLARPPPRVLLIDDVLTSGATAAECARTLREAGAREVGLLTAARSLGGAIPARCYNPAGLRPGSVVAREKASR